jgi:hypothetical protein
MKPQAGCGLARLAVAIMLASTILLGVIAWFWYTQPGIPLLINLYMTGAFSLAIMTTMYYGVGIAREARNCGVAQRLDTVECGEARLSVIIILAFASILGALVWLTYTLLPYEISHVLGITLLYTVIIAFVTYTTASIIDILAVLACRRLGIQQA